MKVKKIKVKKKRTLTAEIRDVLTVDYIKDRITNDSKDCLIRHKTSQEMIICYFEVEIIEGN